jgi:dienelactone hydrolase
MTTAGESFDYHDGDTLCRGEVFRPQDAAGPLPVVLVCHAWDGLVDEVRDKARRLAAEGYIAFAIDVHGNGRTWTDFSELDSALGPWLSDRPRLRRRLLAALEAAPAIAGADPARIGAIGYCFGGLCALDLARFGGAAVQAAVSFHGLLTPAPEDVPERISTSVLVLHGEDDPLVPPEQVADFKAEMNAAGADWQLVSYGRTMHAFTRPGANMPEHGALYSAAADRRSWQAMTAFLAETL